MHMDTFVNITSSTRMHLSVVKVYFIILLDHTPQNRKQKTVENVSPSEILSTFQTKSLENYFKPERVKKKIKGR